MRKQFAGNLLFDASINDLIAALYLRVEYKSIKIYFKPSALHMGYGRSG